MGTKDEKLAQAFGALLRELRLAAGLTLVELGEKAGLHHQAVTRYEAGGRAPTLALLYRLAKALGKNPCDLLPPLPDAAAARKTRRKK